VVDSLDSLELPCETEEAQWTPEDIDPRIKQLSYSSMTLLHACPRQYQLYKLSAGRKEDELDERVTFGFGHAVGSGIQWLMEGQSLEAVIFKLFLNWKEDILYTDTRRNKSLWEAIIAIKRFEAMVRGGYLKDYELVYVGDKPATELSFCISLPDGFRFRGFVDAVLRHKGTGAITVLECKTTGGNAHPAQDKNSAQALGYSVILDVIAPELSSYKVMYLIYQTGDRDYVQMEFGKTYLQRAKWIQDLLLDMEVIKMYEELGDYPQHGQSCFNYFKECKYMEVCTMSTKYLAKPFHENDLDKFEYQVNLTLVDLIASQNAKSAPGTLSAPAIGKTL